jgi:hypothetical protein
MSEWIETATMATEASVELELCQTRQVINVDSETGEVIGRTLVSGYQPKGWPPLPTPNQETGS